MTLFLLMETLTLSNVCRTFCNFIEFLARKKKMKDDKKRILSSVAEKVKVIKKTFKKKNHVRNPEYREFFKLFFSLFQVVMKLGRKIFWGRGRGKGPKSKKILCEEQNMSTASVTLLRPFPPRRKLPARKLTL